MENAWGSWDAQIHVWTATYCNTSPFDNNLQHSSRELDVVVPYQISNYTSLMFERDQISVWNSLCGWSFPRTVYQICINFWNFVIIKMHLSWTTTPRLSHTSSRVYNALQNTATHQSKDIDAPPIYICACRRKCINELTRTNMYMRYAIWILNHMNTCNSHVIVCIITIWLHKRI